MELDAAERLDKMFNNRYEAVLLVAKYARRLNSERTKEKSEGEDTTTNGKKPLKVVTQALKDVIEGKVEFEKPHRG